MTNITTNLFTAKHTVRAFVKSLGLKSTTLSNWLSAVTKTEEFLGRPALLRDLNDTAIAALSDWLEISQLTPSSRHNYRDYIVHIARRAAGSDIVPPLMIRPTDRPVGDNQSRYGLLRYFDDHYVIDRQLSEEPLTADTLKSYRSAVNAFMRFSTGVCTVNNVNSEKIRAFRHWLIDRGMNAKKAGNHAFAVAAIVKHAKPERFIEQAEELTPAIDQTRTLAYVFEKKYLPARQKITSQKTVLKYLASINAFGRFLGHIATLDDLTDENIGAFMRAVLAKGNSPRTVNGYRCKLVALWAWLTKRRIVDAWPTIEEMPEPVIFPVAREMDGVKKLLAGCRRMPGTIVGIPACDWWWMLHVVCWDCCGERTGAMLAMRWDWLDWRTGNLSVPASFRKGGKKPMLYRLKAVTLGELRSFAKPERELMFPWDRDKTSFYHHYRRLLKLAGLPYVKYKSAIQMHRRTFATQLEAIGGNATEAFNHSDRSIALECYLDPKLIDRTPANAQLPSLVDI